MNRVIYILVVALVAVGCRTKPPQKVYQSLQARSNLPPIEEIRPTPKNSIALPVGTVPDPFAWIGISKQVQSLSLSDSALSYEDADSRQRVVSFYKVFRVEITEAGHYELIVESVYRVSYHLDNFSPIGASREVDYLVLDPLVEVRDSTMTRLNVEFVSSGTLFPDWTRPLRFRKNWTFQVLEPTVVYVLVYSDNYNMDRPFGEADENAKEFRGHHGSDGYRINYHPARDGNFFIKVKQAKRETDF
ncbi:MAG: hypothetical protein JNN04_10185 [Cyclobacteriaceae bacterium]|nr:hypothetical protein [Cyclobacteriaceae bacterium]